jgi:hypothetical protein
VLAVRPGHAVDVLEGIFTAEDGQRAALPDAGEVGGREDRQHLLLRMRV